MRQHPSNARTIIRHLTQSHRESLTSDTARMVADVLNLVCLTEMDHAEVGEVAQVLIDAADAADLGDEDGFDLGDSNG